MRARILLSALVLLPLVADGAQAQSYTIQVKAHPAEGKSFTANETSTINISFSLALGGNVLKEEKKVESEERQFTEKVLVAGDKAPRKFSRTYAKALKGEEGALDKLSYAGKTIMFERKGDGYEATADDATILQKDLDDLAKKAGKGDEGAAMFPTKAVKVGDAWPIAKEAFGSFLAGLKDGADVDKLKATGKLVKAYRKDGQQWGTIEINMSVPVNKAGPVPLDKAIPFEIKLTMDAAIDGSSTATQLKGTVAFKGVSEFTQNDQTFTIDIAVVGVLNREHGQEK
jgi:hypothetical protein